MMRRTIPFTVPDLQGRLKDILGHFEDVFGHLGTSTDT